MQTVATASAPAPPDVRRARRLSLSLRTLLILSFVCLLVGGIGLTSYFAFRNGEKAVSQLTGQLQASHAERIRQHMADYLRVPHMINRANLDAIASGMLDVQDATLLEQYFWRQILQFRDINSIAYAGEDASYLGMSRLDRDAPLLLSISDTSTGHHFTTYQLTAPGDRSVLYRRRDETYDPRARPWYQEALSRGYPAWTPIYAWIDGSLGTDAVVPVYGPDQQLRGVLDVSLTLNGIGEYLSDLRISPRGQTFIMGRDGMLIASSSAEPPFVKAGDSFERLAAARSGNPLISQTAQHLSQHFGSLGQIAGGQPLIFEGDGTRQLVYLTPFQDELGLDWLIVVVAPETDFTGQIQANNFFTLLVILLSLLVALAIALLITNRVATPLDRLSRVAGELAAGRWHVRAPITGVAEAQDLAHAFNSMAEQLQQTFDTLETREVHYRTLAHNFPNGAVLLFDQDLRYTLAEGRGLAEAGLSKLELEGRTIWEVFDESITSQIEPSYRAAIAGKHDSREVVFADRIYRVYTMPVTDAYGGRVGMVMTQDITGDKQAQAAIERSERRYKDLVQSLNVVVWQADAQTFAFSFVSEQAEKLLGYPLAQWYASPSFWADHIHPDDRAGAVRYCVESTQALQNHEFEYRMVCADGTLIWLRDLVTVEVVDGRPSQLRGVMIDVTARKLAELALLEKEQELEQRVQTRTQELSTLLDVSHSMASTLDLPQLMGVVLDQLRLLVSYRYASVMLYEDREALVLDDRGRPASQRLVGRRFKLEADSPVHRLLIQGKPMIVNDLHADAPEDSPGISLAAQLRTQGLEATFREIRSWMVVPMISKEQVIGVLSMSHTEPSFFTRRHGELAIALCNHAAIAMENARLYREAQDLAALKERQRLARDLHDAVTQTLFSASLIGEVLPRLWESDRERGLRSLENLRRLTRGALAEMRTLLLELRPEALEKTPLDELLRQLAQTIHSRSQAQLALELATTPLLPPAVQLCIYRITQEALNNSLKYANAGTISIVLAYERSALLLSVRDDGRGFNPAEVGSNHFGLSIMHERAESIGAKLRIDSQLNAGTTIELRWSAS